MRAFLSITVCFFLFVNFASSQFTETIRVKAGDDISKIISPSGVYRFPSFTAGTYVKNNKVTASAKLNYHILTGQMHYLSSNGDTMTIANSSEIDLIKIREATFYYRNGYKEVIAEHDSLKLAVESSINLEYEKIGLYGQSNGAQDIIPVSSYNTDTNIFKLTVGQDAVVRKKTTYYLFYKYEPPVIASKKSFLKIFNKNKAAINNYIENYKVNFNKQEDLKSLVKFCSIL